MRNKFYIAILILTVLTVGGYFFFKQKIGSVNVPETVEVEEGTEITESLLGFIVPEGFAISIFARDLPGARVLELDSEGRFLVSQTKEGKITAVWNTDQSLTADEREVLATGLNRPHGLAFHCDTADQCYLYVAERDSLSRFLYDRDTPALGSKEKLLDLSASLTDRHFTRYIMFLPHPDDNILLISVGSSCDVCFEREGSDYGKILFYNVTTKEHGVYATGLRNAVFMTLDPVLGKVFATEMGRDGLGDDIPPDEINIVEKGKNYGWPICYGKNVHDTEFDQNTYIRNPCMEPFETPSFVDLQAHSAPLGLAFIPEEGWPEEWWYDLLVAYHGSWNRSVPTGYKIVRLKMDAQGKYSGTEDFITGWLTSTGKKLGRPVDIKIFPGGTIFITDDDAGVIYKVSRTNS